MYARKRSRKNGVEMILDEALKAKTVEVIRKNNWVIAVKLVIEVSIVSVISVYALQYGCVKNEKNAFRQDMDEIMAEVRRENEKNINLGD